MNSLLQQNRLRVLENVTGDMAGIGGEYMRTSGAAGKWNQKQNRDDRCNNKKRGMTTWNRQQC